MALASPTKTRLHNLGPLAAIPRGEGRQYQVDDISVAVFRTRDGLLLATQAMCPHRVGPLADGIVGTGSVICPLHGCTFDLATGQPVESSCGPLKTYLTSLSERGEILLSLDGHD